jgi:hypothetical protein
MLKLYRLFVDMAFLKALLHLSHATEVKGVWDAGLWAE